MQRLALYSLLLIVTLTCSISAVHAQGRKYALLVGVETYDPTQLNPLRFAEDDVVAMGAALKNHGFDVVLMTSQARIPALEPVTARDILTQLDRRRRDRDPEDVMIVALSGHGVQLKGDKPDAGGAKETYFCPKRTNLRDKSSMVPISVVMQKLAACRAGRKLLIVDACRNEVEPKGVTNKSVEIELDPAGVTRRSVPKGMLAIQVQ